MSTKRKEEREKEKSVSRGGGGGGGGGGTPLDDVRIDACKAWAVDDVHVRLLVLAREKAAIIVSPWIGASIAAG